MENEINIRLVTGDDAADICELSCMDLGYQCDKFLVSERIRAAIDTHDFIYNGQHLHVTISCGVSVYDANDNLVNSPNEFVNQADQALYISKSKGRNRVTLYRKS